MSDSEHPDAVGPKGIVVRRLQNLRRGFDSRRRLRRQRIREFLSHTARVLETLVERLVTLVRQSNDRGKGLPDQSKGLQGMGLRARMMFRFSENSDRTV
jgi:hypothetical protein